MTIEDLHLFQSRRGKIIEPNLSKLNVKKFDMEFEVDPLFSKTSAAFDEGGTGGLLLNHLRYRYLFLHLTNLCPVDCVSGV